MFIDIIILMFILLMSIYLIMEIKLKHNKMNLKTQYNGKDISITLTKEQIQEINRQSNQPKIVEDINSYLDACEILKEEFGLNASYYEQLNTIARAANFIDNEYKIWEPKFDGNLHNYYPYFKENNSGLVFCSSSYSALAAAGQVAFYLKESTSDYIGKKFIHLYQEIRNKY